MTDDAHVTSPPATFPTPGLSHLHGPNFPELDRRTVPDLLRSAANEVPTTIALVDGAEDASLRRRWTYQELLTIAEKVGAGLLERFSPGDRIAVWEVNRPEWVMLQMGAALAGMTLVTINPAYRTEEFRYAMQQSRSVGLVHGGVYRGISMPKVVADVRDDLSDLHTVMDFDTWESELWRDPAGVTFPEVKPDDNCIIIYTSGTTGFAKGALLHQLGCVNSSRLSAERAGFHQGDVWINPIPLFHTGGGVLASIGTLAMRGTQVVVPQFEPGLVLDLIENERGSLILTVPTILTRLLDHPDRPKRDVSSLRTVMCGASKVAPELIARTKRDLDCDFSILFGQAELHGVVSQTYTTDSEADQVETLGAAMPHMELRIIDPESGRTVPFDTPGEICARGYQSMVEYFDMPDATAATIDAEGWLHTGDIGMMDDRGYLRISGRLKDIIIRGGENIHPLEIEDLLITYPGVAEVAVIGTPDEHWGEQLCAVIRPENPDSPPDPAELRAFCREHLAAFKAPAHWVFIDEFPMTPTGKIQKFRLRQHASVQHLM